MPVVTATKDGCRAAASSSTTRRPERATTMICAEVSALPVRGAGSPWCAAAWGLAPDQVVGPHSGRHAGEPARVLDDLLVLGAAQIGIDGLLALPLRDRDVLAWLLPAAQELLA